MVVARADPPADGIYQVRRGDTLSLIARRFGIPEGKIVALNRLSNRNRIAVGQRLRVAEEGPLRVAAVKAESAPEPAQQPAAEAPEPPEQPAEAVSSADESPTGTASGEEFPPTPEAVVEALDAMGVPTPDPSNYAVTRNHKITVQADETLGHYAEWLGVRASHLRRLNRMRAGTPVVIGRQAKLDFSRVSPETFLSRRLQYHRTLQEEFFGAYEVTSTETHILRKGDTIWYLARRKFDVPVWLLHQYNPDLDFGSLSPGERMIIPRIVPRRG